MESYDSIVVGSGISGLTIATLLGMEHQNVLLIEKAPQIGGSMTRFFTRGVPFDVGFHFTGGLAGNTLLNDMLRVLGIREKIRAVFMPPSNATRFIFERDGQVFDLPTGIPALAARFTEYFPGEASAISRYFDMISDIVRRTPSMDLRRPELDPTVLDEDMISLSDVLDGLTSNRRLRALLSAWCMCHGARPSEVSFANHARVSEALHQSIARVEGGGDAFVHALEEKLTQLGVTIRCTTTIEKLEDIHERKVGRFVLNTGEAIAARNCIFTIHPHEILKLLPRQHLHKAFIQRLQGFESSNGFFSVYGVMEPVEAAGATENMMISLFPGEDMERILDPASTEDSGMVIMRHMEKCPDGAVRRVVDTFEASFPQQVEKWASSKVGFRCNGYREYKQRKTERLVQRIAAACPPDEGSFRLFDAASVLTYRDYLNSPDGSAYGIKQKVGQHNLFGRLPIRNLYAAGQSSLLPGLVGAMMSAFIVWRFFVTPERYATVVNERLSA